MATSVSNCKRHAVHPWVICDFCPHCDTNWYYCSVCSSNRNRRSNDIHGFLRHLDGEDRDAHYTKELYKEAKMWSKDVNEDDSMMCSIDDGCNAPSKFTGPSNSAMQVKDTHLETNDFDWADGANDDGGFDLSLNLPRQDVATPNVFHDLRRENYEYFRNAAYENGMAYLACLAQTHDSSLATLACVDDVLSF
jgi:hypothetical protein